MTKTFLVVLLLVSPLILGVFRGNPALGYQEIPGLPGSVVSGYGTLDIDPNYGDNQALSLNPVVNIPVGKGLLTGEWEQTVDLFNLTETDVVQTEYFKLQYPLHDSILADVGRTLLPFGDWLERYHPSWIQKLRQPPLVSGLLPGHSAEAAQLRGGFRYSLRGSETLFSYTLYQTLGVKTSNYLASKEGSGGRVSLFFPDQQVEWGVSGYAAHGRHASLVGTHLNWRPDGYTSLRGEFTHADTGRGFWLLLARELAKHWPNTPILKDSEVVLRVEQLWIDVTGAGEPVGENHADEEEGHHSVILRAVEDHQEEEDDGMGHEDEGEHAESGGHAGGHHGALPSVDTTRLTAGWNFYPTESRNTKLMLSYTETFAREDDGGRFGVTVSYRW